MKSTRRTTSTPYEQDNKIEGSQSNCNFIRGLGPVNDCASLQRIALVQLPPIINNYSTYNIESSANQTNDVLSVKLEFRDGVSNKTQNLKRLVCKTIN